jgi:hypothetical protein
MAVFRTASAMEPGERKGTSTPRPSATSSRACAKGVDTGTAPAAIASASVPLLLCPSEVCTHTNTSADWNRNWSSAADRYQSAKRTALDTPSLLARFASSDTYCAE